MPELPEVETTRNGIAPHSLHQTIQSVTIRQPQLRWPIPKNLPRLLSGQKIREISRRGKYLLFSINDGLLIVHLGMSGKLCVVEKSTPPRTHDHVDLVFTNGQMLRFTDPRRFGAVLWHPDPAIPHKLLKNLGPEPLSEAFNADYLYQTSRKRQVAIKSFIMNANIVVGVGNIYANEALFMAGIHPLTSAGKLSRARYQKLVEAVKQVLAAAIKQGGTTLRDFQQSDGKPGYFKQELRVYGRGGDSCVNCEKPLKEIRVGQRSTVFCRHCQRK